MGGLGWTVLFGSLFVIAISLLALIGLRLWRTMKALGRDLEKASEVLADFGSAPDHSGPR
jgi:hypothetical protein